MGIMDSTPARTATASDLPAPTPQELTALSTDALLVALPDAGVLTLAGEDRVDFLHGQVANDVRGLPPGGTNTTLLLNHKGHALAQLRVLRGEELIITLVEDGAIDLVEESLESHIIFDQVTLGRRPDLRAFTLQGGRAGEILTAALGPGVLPAPGHYSELAGAAGAAGRVLVVPARRSEAGGFDLLTEADDAAAITGALRAAGAAEGSRAALDLARVCAGIASAAGEGGEGVLPQEAGLEEYLSYRKGCYLGQEIMARIEARGNMRRGLSALRLDGPPQPGERDITLDGRRVGRLGTAALHPAAGPVALAVLRNDLPEGAEVEVGGVRARPVTLPLALA